MPQPVRLVVYSDYLCPWCYAAAHRLHTLEREFGDALCIDWRSYLLRPRPPSEPRDLEKFRAYTRNWLRIGSEPDAPEFRAWQGDAGPPSHSIPAHAVAKAAARLGPEAFGRIHERLLRGYFSESRDVSDTDTLLALWREVDLPDEAFAAREEPALLERIVDEHNEALSVGANGVPAARMSDSDIAIVGAQPLETYRRWIERTLARSEQAARSA